MDHAQQQPGVSFAARQPCQCRYPLWGMKRPAYENLRFCGKARADGRPYCAEHVRLCYKPAET